MNTVNFSLTQEHINNGKPGNPDKCPVALCIKEKLEENNVVIGLDGDMRANCFINLVPVFLPYFVQKFVDNFDDRKSVRPIDFSLKIPSDCLTNELKMV